MFAESVGPKRQGKFKKIYKNNTKQKQKWKSKSKVLRPSLRLSFIVAKG